MKKITIFTPTYNRGYILGQAYESLLAQTSKNFVWLIVDDGSTDNTSELVKNWQKENKINVEYIKQENQGKHIAHNTAVKNCNTEFFLILDSDDFLSKNAIEVLEKEIKKIEKKEEISGIIGNRWMPKNNKVIGTEMPKNVDFVSGLELYQKYGFKGDTLRLYKTKILKEFLFPKIKGENFIYENVVFDIIDSKYRMLINREKLYYCDYLEEGYTANAEKVKETNPKGYAYALNSKAKYSITLWEKIKGTILYIAWCKRHKIKNACGNFYNSLLYIIMYIPSIVYMVGKERKRDVKNN